MPKLWKNISPKRFTAYELNRLIDHHLRQEFPVGNGPFQVVCDIDKTYLETRFESFVDIIQVALETATAKQTVEGAADILMAARWGNIYGQETTDTNGLHFVSSSPPQLRSVLEEKLMIDGLEWDSDTFKNQAYNLLKGKVGFLKQHLAYKSAAIFNVIQNSPENSQFIFIGDNAESDPIIYLGVTLFLAGVLSQEDYLKYLATAGADEQTLKNFRERLLDFGNRRVCGIIIRNAPGYTRSIPDDLKGFVRSFDHFYETAFHFHNIGVFADEVLVKLTKDMHNYYGIDRSYLCGVIEAACIDRDSSYVELMKQCMKVLKISESTHWKKDLTRDLRPFDFSKIEEISAARAIDFAKNWHR